MSVLRHQRISLNLTQEELAKILGVTSTTLARWERGESKPDAEGMLELAMEALQARAILGDSERAERRNKIKASVGDTLKQARKRVKHSQVERV